MDLDRLRALVRAGARRWGSDVRDRREALGLSQAQLARLVDGLSVQTISKIERGEIVPRDYLKVGIATCLAVEPGELFPLPTRRDVAELAKRDR